MRRLELEIKKKIILKFLGAFEVLVRIMLHGYQFTF